MSDTGPGYRRPRTRRRAPRTPPPTRPSSPASARPPAPTRSPACPPASRRAPPQPPTAAHPPAPAEPQTPPSRLAAHNRSIRRVRRPRWRCAGHRGPGGSAEAKPREGGKRPGPRATVSVQFPSSPGNPRRRHRRPGRSRAARRTVRPSIGEFEHRGIEVAHRRHDLHHGQHPRRDVVGRTQHPAARQLPVEPETDVGADARAEIGREVVGERAVEGQQGPVDADRDRSGEDLRRRRRCGARRPDRWPPRGTPCDRSGRRRPSRR